MTNFFRNCGASFGTESVKAGAQAPTSVTLFDQGLIDVLEAAVTGLQPTQPYFLALSDNADGSGQLEPLEDFITNPAGAAIVNTTGPILQNRAGWRRCAPPLPGHRIRVVNEPGQPRPNIGSLARHLQRAKVHRNVIDLAFG
jgi:hypothetical protein